MDELAMLKIELVGLAPDAADKFPSELSGGMIKRAALARALALDPDIVFLDEPTTGVDPRGRVIMWDIVRDLAEQGTTIFLTTQYLEEADQLADRIALLDHGRIVAEGTADELKRRIPGGHVRLQFPDADAMAAAAAAFGTAAIDEQALSLHVPSDGSPAALRSVLDRVDALAVTVEALSIHTPDLDDVFLALTGQPTATTTSEDDR
jgi:ABC-2 type transport system ATP-binding protein